MAVTVAIVPVVATTMRAACVQIRHRECGQFLRQLARQFRRFAVEGSLPLLLLLLSVMVATTTGVTVVSATTTGTTTTTMFIG